MIILGLAAEHNSSACLMINGKIKGLIQEERQTNKHKNPICRLMYQSIFDVFLSFFNTELENECCFGLIVLTINFRNNYAQT